MHNIISNTSCLIVLGNIGKLNVLKDLYGKIHVTEEVCAEYGKNLPAWIEVLKVQDRKCVKIIHSLVDLGEASTIALSTEMTNSLMILDDLKARKLAQKLDLNFTGTLGVLARAREKNIVKSLATILQELENTNFRISIAMKNELLKYDNI